MKESMNNPLTIMLINMTIVFAVLYSLGWIIRLIQYIDPTKKKEAPKQAQAPAAIEVAPVAAPVAAAVEAQQEDDLEFAAVIAAAIAACGYQARQIASIRPVGGQAWASAARLEVVNTRNQMS